MDWIPYLIIVLAIGAVPGLILGPRLLTIAMAAVVVVVYVAGMIRLAVWAAGCWDCRYQMGLTEKVYQSRADAFWVGFGLFSTFVGLILAGLLLGAVVRQLANSKLNRTDAL